MKVFTSSPLVWSSWVPGNALIPGTARWPAVPAVMSARRAPRPQHRTQKACRHDQRLENLFILLVGVIFLKLLWVFYSSEVSWQPKETQNSLQCSQNFSVYCLGRWLLLMEQDWGHVLKYDWSFWATSRGSLRSFFKWLLLRHLGKIIVIVTT